MKVFLYRAGWNSFLGEEVQVSPTRFPRLGETLDASPVTFIAIRLDGAFPAAKGAQ
jgi:hypothetical protein